MGAALKEQSIDNIDQQVQEIESLGVRYKGSIADIVSKIPNNDIRALRAIYTAAKHLV
ncbi:hypothetical protein R2R35_20030 [Anaerocolumna sp. AGMB13020]|uniref:hypothetical protein n=1 Tax=Anaerocolumna sp. AGMB13020 TaxID=3081750 RepID=UPI002952D41A|nr:hypothetical protein [Anaerocolumna sp. AGMB13020]WOO35992.1 hypothetical protein R2R35_19675 [Anaerocolumna sp. AGMB13020]WOO36062.1 hypothetical protein R2R35_20030 [Anaerocolumna sp. AGMB13020]